MSWVATAVAAVGVGTSLYGANKQSKDQAHQNDLNRQATAGADLSAWKAYLMQRGIDPSGVTSFGEIPVGGKTVNTKLPLYARMQTYGRAGGPPPARRKILGVSNS